MEVWSVGVTIFTLVFGYFFLSKLVLFTFVMVHVLHTCLEKCMYFKHSLSKCAASTRSRKLKKVSKEDSSHGFVLQEVFFHHADYPFYCRSVFHFIEKFLPINLMFS